MKIEKIGFVAVPVTDISRAREFYEGVLGLKETLQAMDGKWVEYDIADNTLCICNIAEDWIPSDQGTSVALNVSDFDAAGFALRRAGAKFALEPFEAPGCWIAVIQDPDGNKLTIHKLKSNRGEES